MGGSRDVLVFAGQGSDGHFSDKHTTARLVERLGQTAEPLWTSFLSQCHYSFEKLYRSLPEEERSIFPDDILASLSTPSALLHPPAALHSHPVLQATTLFVRQVLEILVYESYCGGSTVVAEVSGVCTGVLAAILAAAYTSYDSAAFITTAVHGFRISFWVGLRASLWCRAVVGPDWRADPCLLSVFKLPAQVVAEHLNEFNSSLAVRIYSPPSRPDTHSICI
jgi:Starter unit:ACP transacylase in aflatoxin biosynthesis